MGQNHTKPQWLVPHGCGGFTTSGGLARDLTETPALPPAASYELMLCARAGALCHGASGVLRRVRPRRAAGRQALAPLTFSFGPVSLPWRPVHPSSQHNHTTD